jgi:hypothetical protein
MQQDIEIVAECRSRLIAVPSLRIQVSGFKPNIK